MPLVLHQRAFLLSAGQALVATERVHLPYHLDFISSLLLACGGWFHTLQAEAIFLTNRRAASASATMLLFYLHHLGRNKEASKIHHQSVDMPCKTTQTLKHMNTHIHNRKREGKPLSTIHLLASPALTSGLYTTHKQQHKLAGQRAEGTGQRTRQDTQEQALSPPAPLPSAR